MDKSTNIGNLFSKRKRIFRSSELSYFSGNTVNNVLPLTVL